MRAVRTRFLAVAVMGGALSLTAACTDPAQPDAPPGEDEGAGVSAAEAKPIGESIFREDIEGAPKPAVLDDRVEMIGFAQGGADLDQGALETLNAMLKLPHIEAGGAIELRAHSDAGGSDAANMRASEARGQVVKEWLEEQGVAAERIRVIAFGDQNPVEPNAMPDGSPNEEGRAANRRVEVTLIGSDAATTAPPPSDEPEKSED